jgi:D-alanyl-D-alanine carboxypeptidase
MANQDDILRYVEPFEQPVDETTMLQEAITIRIGAFQLFRIPHASPRRRECYRRINLKRKAHAEAARPGGFERAGFIWGGKWYHFDTFHFEYRPEIIALAKQGWPGN